MTRNTRLFTGLLVTTLFAANVQADLIISAPTLTVTPGTVGHFGVLLTNTGPQSSFVSAFDFDISTNDPSISFTDARPCFDAFQHPLPPYCSGEAPYIFKDTSSALTHGLSSIADQTGQELVASDGAYHGGCCDLGPASVVSLAEVFYSIAPSTSLGPVAITFIPYPEHFPYGTYLASYEDIISSTTRNGEFNVIPEPNRLALLAGSLLLLALGRRRRLSHKRTTA